MILYIIGVCRMEETQGDGDTLIGWTVRTIYQTEDVSRMNEATLGRIRDGSKSTQNLTNIKTLFERDQENQKNKNRN